MGCSVLFSLVGALLIIAVILLAELEIEIKIVLKNGVNYSFIVLKLFRGILRFRLNLNLDGSKEGFYSFILRKLDSKLDNKTSLEEVFKLVKKNYKKLPGQADTAKYILSKTRVSNLSLNLELGTGDAAQTAIISGAIAFIFSALQSYIRTRYSLGPQALRVLPYFNHRVFNMDLDCIIHLRIGHIIIAGTRIIGSKIKGR